MDKSDSNKDMEGSNSYKIRLDKNDRKEGGLSSSKDLSKEWKSTAVSIVSVDKNLY